MRRPYVIRCGTGGLPKPVIIKCPHCCWMPIPQAAFDLLPRRSDDGNGGVQCCCGEWVPWEQGR